MNDGGNLENNGISICFEKPLSVLFKSVESFNNASRFKLTVSTWYSNTHSFSCLYVGHIH